MDLLIKNASVIDGTGRPLFKANIGIKDNKISYIGKEIFSAKRIIEANQYILSPGFIDTHSHSDFTILADPRAEGKITQGITTEINGNCGVSAFPMIGETFERRLPELNVLGLQGWNSIDKYVSILKKRQPAINITTLCGHGNLRGSVIGYKNMPANKKQMIQMKNLLRKQFSYKIRGISTGLIYPPGIFADTEELIEITKIIKSFKGIYATHMRSEGDKLLSAVEEALVIGRKAEIPVHISHLKTSGRENWWKINSLLTTIESALRDGIRVTADRYPYTASATDLDAFLPSWIIEGKKEDIITRLKSIKVRREIKKHLKKKGKSFLDNLIISDVFFENDKKFEGKRIGEFTDIENAADFISDLLIRSELNVGVIYFSMSEENLIRILSKPYVMIGTDSSARCSSGVTSQGKPHPRGFGSFTRFIRKYVLEKKLMSLEEAIRKITFLPAKTFKIEKRGIIREGYFADIVIFDPAEIEDRATFEEPFKISKGIKYVIVNGAIAVEDGCLTGSKKGEILL
ncbi:MAG: D-aminoacylase [Thermodesulfovibrio sp.]|nr:D-aminoacylase [Thermodesulfovibrio sp.]